MKILLHLVTAFCIRITYPLRGVKIKGHFRCCVKCYQRIVLQQFVLSKYFQYLNWIKSTNEILDWKQLIARLNWILRPSPCLLCFLGVLSVSFLFSFGHSRLFTPLGSNTWDLRINIVLLLIIHIIITCFHVRHTYIHGFFLLIIEDNHLVNFSNF